MSPAMSITPEIAATVEFTVRRVSPAERDDVRQEVLLAVLKALPRFDAARGCTTRTFIAWRAHGALQDYWRRHDPVSRRFRLKIKAGDSSVNVPTFVAIAKLHRSRLPADPGPSPLEEVLYREMCGELKSKLRQLKPQYFRVLTGYYLEDRSMKEIANELKVSEARTWQIRSYALKKLRLLMSGPQSSPVCSPTKMRAAA